MPRVNGKVGVKAEAQQRKEQAQRLEERPLRNRPLVPWRIAFDIPQVQGEFQSDFLASSTDLAVR